MEIKSDPIDLFQKKRISKKTHLNFKLFYVFHTNLKSLTDVKALSPLKLGANFRLRAVPHFSQG